MAPEMSTMSSLRKSWLGVVPRVWYIGAVMRQERGRRDRERPAVAGIACVILRHNPCPDQTSATSEKGSQGGRNATLRRASLQKSRTIEGARGGKPGLLGRTDGTTTVAGFGAQWRPPDRGVEPWIGAGRGLLRCLEGSPQLARTKMD